MANFFAVWRTMGSLETFSHGPFPSATEALSGADYCWHHYEIPQPAPGTLRAVPEDMIDSYCQQLRAEADTELELLLIEEAEIEEALKRHQ